MHTLIIGSGVAGWTLARELRRADPEAQITLICKDSGDFYSKPMLSNAIAGKKGPEQLVMTPAAKMGEQQKVTVHGHTDVLSIDTQSKTVSTAQGTHTWDQLVLATGADTIRLPIEGTGAADILSVNDLQDYGVFHERLKTAKRIAILGAGLIGCEFANDLLGNAHEVSVYDIAPLPLGRLLPPEAAEIMRQKLATAGVQWRLNDSVARVDRNDTGFELTAKSGAKDTADLVLSAVGLKPRIALAQAAGIGCGRGIQVDALGQTSASGVYSLGDCAEYPGGLVLPYILPVMQAARALAQTLAGKPTPIKFPAMPVTVKTPACPTVVAPPAMGAAGQWVIEGIENGLRALYKAADGSLLGAALIGEATKERQAIAGQLPPVLA